jgi:hypothetical protein
MFLVVRYGLWMVKLWLKFIRMLDRDQMEIQMSASYFIPVVEAMRPVQVPLVTPTLFGVGKQVPWKLERNVPNLVSRRLTCGIWNNSSFLL